MPVGALGCQCLSLAGRMSCVLLWNKRNSALSLDKGIVMKSVSFDKGWSFLKATCCLQPPARCRRVQVSKTSVVRAPKLSLRSLIAAAGSVGLLTLAGHATGAPGDYVFAEGNAALLSGVKRVIISNFVVAFQLDGAVRKDDATRVGNTTFFGGNAKEVEARMAWKSPDVAVMQEIADAGLAALKAEFKAKGIEVLDESVLASQAAYASILEATGLKSLDDYSIVNTTEAVYRSGNNTGALGLTRVSEAKIASAKGTRPYGHSVFEGGLCCHVRKGYPSSKAYYVPGFEIDVAKALDAVVVKVWQYVYFTQLEAGVSQDSLIGTVGGRVVNYSANAKSVVRIGEQKTRMSFRLPSSTNKARNTPTAWVPMDGDVVVHLSKPMLVGDQYFNLEDGGASASLAGTQRFNFTATLADVAAYRTDVSKAIGETLGGLATTAVGR